ncbi:AbrB/MazE/SpoVT family DNA-binding domain-containing protein [Candidatus Daviesbacteria bacterium]|nr:AbrB/MazE/SpoVT family DNA-binding domain-containing protein [Candidatus Daviesbacteria bacterium]
MGKVFKNGNSLAVTVPKVYAHDLNISHGSTVEWVKTDQGLLLKSENSKFSGAVTPEFAKLVEEIINEHEDVLKELAKR